MMSCYLYLSWKFFIDSTQYLKKKPTDINKTTLLLYLNINLYAICIYIFQLKISITICKDTVRLTYLTSHFCFSSDGQKMSKRKKNYPDPLSIIHKYGADALRYKLVLCLMCICHFLCKHLSPLILLIIFLTFGL